MLIDSFTSGVALPRHDLTTMADKLRESRHRDLVSGDGSKALEAYALVLCFSVNSMVRCWAIELTAVVPEGHLGIERLDAVSALWP